MFGLAACWSSTAPPSRPVAPPADPPKLVPACGDAAIGLERGTQTLRAPEQEIGKAMHDQCVDGGWSTEAIACFAKMTADDLGRCVGMLAPLQRDAVFEQLNGTDRASVAIALVKLDGLKIGIPECDRFVATVILVLGCEAMPIATRVQLGVDTADFWSLPGKLPASQQQRMATVCQQSLDTLAREAQTIGCL